MERATWGEYLLVPPEQGPDALGDSNLLARASRIADPYYIGFGTAAAHYGLTTQHRNVIYDGLKEKRKNFFLATNYRGGMGRSGGNEGQFVRHYSLVGCEPDDGVEAFSSIACWHLHGS